MIRWFWAISGVAVGLYALDGLYWTYNYPEDGTFLHFLAEYSQVLGPMGLGLALIAVSASLPRKERVFDHTLLISMAVAQELEFVQWMLYSINYTWVVPFWSDITDGSHLLWLFLAVRLPTWAPIRRRWWFLLSVVFFLYGSTRVFYHFGSYIGAHYVMLIAPFFIVSGLYFLMRRPRGLA